MGTQVVTGSPVEAAVLTQLLSIHEAKGEVSNADVKRAAQVLGRTTRTVRRMIARGYVRKERTTWAPEQDLAALLVQQRGCITAIRRELARNGSEPQISVRTMQRGFKDRFDQHLLAGARGGYLGMFATLPVLERFIEHRNDEWAIDHTLLPVFVRAEDGSWCKPWMTTVLDAATRMVLAITISANASTLEETVETIAVAAEGFTTEDGVFVGGQPQSLLSDRGGDLVTQAVTIGLIAHGTQRNFTEAYSPHQNGRIERWHRTVKEEFCRRLPGYDRSDMTARDPRKESKPLVDPVHLLPIETLQVELAKAMREYNFDRAHSKLDGATPFEAWARDTAEITRADAQAIRASMTQSTRRKVTRGQVRFGTRSYHLPHTNTTVDGVEASWRVLLEGKFVTVRYLPTRPEFVEIETERGEHVGRGHWSKLLDEDEARKVLGGRRKAIATLRTAMEDIAEAEVRSTQALVKAATEAAAPHDPDTVDFGPLPEHSRPKAKKRPGSAQAAMKKAKDFDTARDDLAAISASVAARTGTDDLDATDHPGADRDDLAAITAAVAARTGTDDLDF